MPGASQTPGMNTVVVVVVNRNEQPLDGVSGLLAWIWISHFGSSRVVGIPLMLIDSEHLTWADKVSGTYVKKL